MRHLKEDAREYGVALAASAVFIGGMVWIFGASCPMRILFGIPCPGCGMTRALVLLCQGKVLESVQMHPMALLLILGIGFGLAERYGGLWHRRWKGNLLLWYLVGWAVACVLLYLVRMYLLFPHTPPMLYEEAHLFHGLDRLWKQ